MALDDQAPAVKRFDLVDLIVGSAAVAGLAWLIVWLLHA